jgi:hypothetical protein
VPLEIPGRETPHVKVERVQAGLVTVSGELNLEFQLVSLSHFR